MVHPCGAERESDGRHDREVLHAVQTDDATKTICGLDATLVNTTVGWDKFCRTCYPKH